MAVATPRLATSLRVLRRDVDRLWPDRSTSKDGWVGDWRHAQRVSDHNPDEQGIVHALDVTAYGIDPWWLVVAATHHPSTHYVIFRRRIWSLGSQWQVRPYGGDPHQEHVHISIWKRTAAERRTRHWLTAPSR